LKTYHSLAEISHDINSGSISCAQIITDYLKKIEQKKHLNVFLEVYSAEAKAQAERIDSKIKNGTAGKLAGMVVGLKDVICHKDHRLQSASKILDGFISQFNGTAVERLLKEDAIIIGRQNCDEFAMGSSNENSAFGPTLNAANHSKVPGGSSGASAVAIQANLCLISLGSDTGGSVRQPASFCGVVGLKPTYSRISRYGLIAYASSFDSIGIMGNNAEDIASVLEVIAGEDDYDSTVSTQEVPNYLKQLTLKDKVSVGYFNAGISSHGLQKEVVSATKNAIDRLALDGHLTEGFDFDLMDHFLPTYYVLTAAEASTNLSRYDGARYGFRSDETLDLQSMYKKSRSQGFGHEVQKRIMLGTFVLSHGYYDAYYSKAQKIRRLIKEETEKLLEKYDFLLLPTAPKTAFELGEHSKDPISMYLADIFTVQASLAGTPAISIPNGTDSNGMPIGLQVISKQFNEGQLLAFTKYFMSEN
jgi:aspartyl-tRNA(Asn)/glutamyl-tRNA(Gln) amidotransferase subunit A